MLSTYSSSHRSLSILFIYQLSYVCDQIHTQISHNWMHQCVEYWVAEAVYACLSLMAAAFVAVAHCIEFKLAFNILAWTVQPYTAICLVSIGVTESKRFRLKYHNGCTFAFHWSKRNRKEKGEKEKQIGLNTFLTAVEAQSPRSLQQLSSLAQLFICLCYCDS